LVYTAGNSALAASKSLYGAEGPGHAGSFPGALRGHA
jgi:hypothetical protein